MEVLLESNMCKSGSRQNSDPWLTLNHEYLVLSMLVALKGPAMLRVVADDNRTPIFVDATMFAASAQPLPRTWVAKIGEGGALEIGPRRWLELGFWDRYFDGDAAAVAVVGDEVQVMTND
jgi:hypothetical protein